MNEAFLNKENIPFTLIFTAAPEKRAAILDHIEETEGHRVMRVQETSSGAISIKFKNFEPRLQEQLRDEIFRIDQTATLRNALGHNERLI